jgi:hypothetical protein
MKRIAWGWMLLVAVLVASGMQSTALSSEPVLDKGVAYLAGSQHADGSWGKLLDVQATAFAIMALEAGGRSCLADRAELEKAELTTAYELALGLLGTKSSAVAQRLLAL